MRVSQILLHAGLLISAATSSIAASWTFTDATVSISGKANAAGGPVKEKLTPSKPLVKTIILDSASTIRVILTTSENKSPRKPHQAHILLSSPITGLDIAYPFSVKDSGKATVSLSLKDLPVQFQRTKTPLTANIVIASFGSTTGYNSPAFTLLPDAEGVALGSGEKPLRYGQLEEIHHVFKSDPSNPPKVLSLVFALALVGTVPVLLGSWLYLGGNLNHLGKAMNTSPLSHALFVGSIVSIEGVLFLYYTTWNLFQTLPVLGAIGVVALVSGSRALTEVQERRLAGLR